MKQLDRFLYENQKRIRLDTIETAAFFGAIIPSRGVVKLCRTMKTIYQKSIFWCACPRPHPMNVLYEWQEKMAQAFCGSLRALCADSRILWHERRRYRSTAGEYTSCAASLVQRSSQHMEKMYQRRLQNMRGSPM